MRTGRNLGILAAGIVLESRSLGYAHWPEQAWAAANPAMESRSLGYAHWPEQDWARRIMARQSRSLGYAHWPEPHALRMQAAPKV